MQSSYRFDGFELRPRERVLLRDGAPVVLGGRAFDVLVALVERADRVVGSRELFEVIWPGLVVEENNLRQQVAALRRVLGTSAILTVPGRGYRFMPALQVATAPRAARRPAIAVLPFLNLSSDASQDYFADAITQDIITALSRYRWLSVVARNTVFGYKNQPMNVTRMAAELGVQYLVEGSVQRSGGSLRVTAQLVDAVHGSTCWCERYDRSIGEVFDVQDEITQTLVGSLEPEIGLAERRKVHAAPRANLQAWECCHLAVSHFFRFTAPDNQQALQLLQRSREMDPAFAEAHAWWAYASVLDMVYWSAQPHPERLLQALDAVQQALQLDDRNAVFYVIKGRVQLARGEYESARAENLMAIALNPTLAAAHCALGDTLAYQGRYDESLEPFRKALALSPRDPQRWAFLSYAALAMIFKGDLESATEWATQARELPNCQYWATAHLAVAHALQGRQQQARACVQQLLQRQPGFTLRFAQAKLFYLRDARQTDTYLTGLAQAGVPA